MVVYQSFSKTLGSLTKVATIALISIIKIAFIGKHIINNKTVAKGFLKVQATKEVVITVTQKIGSTLRNILRE